MALLLCYVGHHLRQLKETNATTEIHQNRCGCRFVCVRMCRATKATCLRLESTYDVRHTVPRNATMQTYCKIEMQPKPLQLGLLTFQRPNALVTLPNSSTINNDGRLRSTGKPGPQRKNTRCANTCKRPFLGSLHNAFSKASLSPCCTINNVTNLGTQLLLNTVVAGLRTKMHHSLQPKMMTN